MSTRFATLGLVALVALAGCKSHPKMDLPLYPDASMSGSGGNDETEQGTMFHVVLRTPDSANQVRSFYRKTCLDERGWAESGPGIYASNVTHSGDFGLSASVTAVDPTLPGGWVQVAENNNVTLIDVWQSVPKGKK